MSEIDKLALVGLAGPVFMWVAIVIVALKGSKKR